MKDPPWQAVARMESTLRSSGTGGRSVRQRGGEWATTVDDVLLGGGGPMP